MIRPQGYFDYFWKDNGRIFWVKHATKIDCIVMCPKSGIKCSMSASSVRRKFTRAKKSVITIERLSAAGRIGGKTTQFRKKWGAETPHYPVPNSRV